MIWVVAILGAVAGGVVGALTAPEGTDRDDMQMRVLLAAVFSAAAAVAIYTLPR